MSHFRDDQTVLRVSVVGNSGSGKSTLGRALAARLGVPYVELDAIFHLPAWTELPRDEFRKQVGALAAGDAWVIDGNYLAVRDLVWARADTVVWIDLLRLRRPSEVRTFLGKPPIGGKQENADTASKPEAPD